jgi:hypothetical protein
MNLQVCVPYEPCPFKCPMCIARNRKVFDNLYAAKPADYFSALRALRDNKKYDYFILTGNSDPTLHRLWLEEVSSFLQETRHGIELQTRNYNLKGYNLDNIGTTAYSINTLRNYLKAWNFRKTSQNNRMVILLTKEFEFLNADNFDPMGFNQITFKMLQLSGDALTNDWIMNNQMQDFSGIYQIINYFNGSDVSIRLDANCQESHGRYEIFREDGNVYKAWEDETP